MSKSTSKARRTGEQAAVAGRTTGERAAVAAQVTTLDGAAGREVEAAQLVAALVAVHPPGLRWRLALDEDEVRIGRGARGAAQLDHGTVSRHHLAIRWDAAARAHVAIDLGSRNGARVDGARLGDRPVALADGSVVQLGDVFAIYELGAGSDERGDGARRGDGDGGDGGGGGDSGNDGGSSALTETLPGRSAAMTALRALVARAAPDPSPVLITGETGTGKEWIARALHAGAGRSGPLVAVNCAALGRELLESQLFGHVRGAFTGAAGDQPGLFRAADGGTLFLDELGELPLELQPKLLRALQEREVLAVGATRPIKVDVRVCAATNRDLAAAIERDELRRDLYARLALWEIAVPPLRARRVDVLDWLARLHRRWCAERGRTPRPLELAPAAVEAILLHPWRDNLRGLERLVHVLAAHSGGGPIQRQELPAWLLAGGEPAASTMAATAGAAGATSAPAAQASPATAEASRPAAPTREELELAYAELGGNVRALARKFGRDRRQIYRWLEAYGLGRGEG